MIDSLLRLFNSIKVDSRDNVNIISRDHVKEGILFHPSIKVDSEILDTVRKHMVSFKEMNNTFHKSWDKVANSPMYTLVFEQTIHYMTTYGFDALGIYSDNTVFIPKEDLRIPDLMVDEIELFYVNGITKSQILKKIIKLGSGVALNDYTITDIMTVIEDCGYSVEIIKSIKNKELLSQLYKHFDVAPTEPVDFLRYLIYNLTGVTLIIKNKNLTNMILNSDQELLDSLILKAPTNLSSIFLRYKSLFLSMKKVSKNKTFFNRLRKDAKKTHRPLPIDYLNTITDNIKKRTLDFELLSKALKNANVFRKIRLINSLKYRMNPVSSIFYKIRNGKGWVSEFDEYVDEQSKGLMSKAVEVISKSLYDNLKGKVSGSTFLIPNTIEYAVPSSEKDFIGNFPSNTSISMKQDMLVGISWENTDTGIVDLDLSLISASSKIGWDGDFRADNGKVLFL